MNEPIEPPIANFAAECCADLDERVRRNPTATLLIAAGVGLAIALLGRALRPEPTPQRRLQNLLDDLEDRLREAATPMLRRATGLASSGAEAVRDVAQDGGAWGERLFRGATRRVRKLVG